MSYLVDNEDNRLVFVGDSELNFLFIGYLTYTPNQTKLIEYLDDRVTTMNVPPCHLLLVQIVRLTTVLVQCIQLLSVHNLVVLQLLVKHANI